MKKSSTFQVFVLTLDVTIKRHGKKIFSVWEIVYQKVILVCKTFETLSRPLIRSHIQISYAMHL